LLATLFQALQRCLGRFSLLARLLTFLPLLYTPLQLLQALKFILFPGQVTLVLAEARSTDAPQMANIPRPPEIEHRVIADHKRTGNRQLLARNTLERLFKRLPGRVRNNSGTPHIHATSPGTPRQLAVFIGSKQAHLDAIEFAQAA